MSDFFDEIPNVVFDSIIINMDLPVIAGIYGVTGITYIATVGYNVVRFISNLVILQEDINTDERVLKTIEVEVEAEYLRMMKDNNN